MGCIPICVNRIPFIKCIESHPSSAWRTHYFCDPRFATFSLSINFCMRIERAFVRFFCDWLDIHMVQWSIFAWMMMVTENVFCQHLKKRRYLRGWGKAVWRSELHGDGLLVWLVCSFLKDNDNKISFNIIFKTKRYSSYFRAKYISDSW